MRYAVISDIHANLEALTAVMDECRRLQVQTIVCLGDIVGYGASPKECLDEIRSANIPTVAGNHDWALAGRLDASCFTDDGKAALAWTLAQLDMRDVAYLESLPLTLKNHHLIMVHGSLNRPETFQYLSDIADAPDTLEKMDRAVCFVGHTHVPCVFCQNDGRIYEHGVGDIEIQPGMKLIVNCGSVGQPRDGNPLASFCIFDSAQSSLAIHRIPYDLQTAQRKIRGAGLPSALAERLATG